MPSQDCLNAVDQRPHGKQRKERIVNVLGVAFGIGPAVIQKPQPPLVRTAADRRIRREERGNIQDRHGVPQAPATPGLAQFTEYQL